MVSLQDISFHTENIQTKRAKLESKFTLQEAEEELNATFDKLIEDLMSECKARFDVPVSALDRIREMCYYTVKGGKAYRGTLVLSTVAVLCQQRQLEVKTRLLQAMVVAWCVEILQASFLIADDIMDKSTTRRGKLCWYKKPDVGDALAINDAVMMESMAYHFLKRQFSSSPLLYIALVDLFREVSFVTELGQMLDLQGEKSKGKDGALDAFTPKLYQQIIVNKTAMYTFYLPIAAGMLLCGLDEGKQYDTAKAICLELGAKFQIQDDYLDVFGDPEKIGKKGTDIASHKCSWLAVTGLSLMNLEQKKIMETYYGHDDDKSEEQIKNLFRSLELCELYQKQEQESYDKVKALVNTSANVLPPNLFLPILNKIHGREK